MSKKIRFRITALFAALFILTALIAMPMRSVQGQGGAAASAGQQTAANAKSASIMAATEAALRETSQIRELSILRSVKSGAQSRSEIESMIVKNLDEETTPEEMHATEVELKKLGLAPANFQYRPFIIKLLTEQVAGYYDPKAQEFYLADWIDLGGQKPVMVHELTHALQDQHFDLKRFDKWPKGDSDAELAAHALVEGDATLTMIKYMASNPQSALEFEKSLSSSEASTEQINHAPRVLRETLLFPYTQGLNWTMKLYQRGGWAMVSKAFTDLPQSTEQLLHSEKYFAREASVKVALADIHAMLGNDWKRIDYDVNGEWSYSLILDEFLKSSGESKRAAEGWGGDRYAVYEDAKSGSVMLTQMTVWDTEQDAREFFDAYAKRTVRRYISAREISSAAAEQGLRRAWTTSEGNVIMERRGARVLILEGLPEKADEKSMLEALWK